jgi:putative proteasome-type protease
MTYCLAIKVNSGMVLASDSRTNAGVDYVSVYSKMRVYDAGEDRVFVLMTSGNLATSQAVMNMIARDLVESTHSRHLGNVTHVFEAAEYIGDLGQEVERRHLDAMKRHNIKADSNFILAGQIDGDTHEIFHIYPQGNYISASPETPYLQIGETKYGKPILDRIISPATSLEDAARCALVSIDSTMRSNISVGPPVDLAIIQKDSFKVDHQLNLKLGSPLYASLQKRWNDGLRRAFSRLPRFEWEEE